MTRLALAKTIVTGSVTLQGNTYTFTGSGSGTATADRVPEAKKLAVASANAAAITSARASIDKILADNSSVLTDLEITSLISNNLSTTVVVFKPITMSSIASSLDGVNYTLNQDTTIGAGQWLTVQNGTTLTMGKYHFTNNGYFQIGEPLSALSTMLKEQQTIALATYSTDASNNGSCEINPYSICTINSGITFENCGNYASLTNSGGVLNNNGNIINSGNSTGLYNTAYQTQDGDTCVYVLGYCYNGSSNNSYSTITNSGNNSEVYNTAIFYNYASIKNTGVLSSTSSVGYNCNGYISDNFWISETTGSCSGNCDV